MIEGLWRNTHFLLAISISLFLIVASITGTFLGIEAIFDQTKQHSISELDKHSLKKTMDAFQDNFEEVYEISITKKNNVVVQGITLNGFETVYADPKTGKKIKKVEPKTNLSNFMRNLHRSLFLKKTGRFIMGFISFLSALLVLTGFLLLLRRVGGLAKFFKPLKEKHFFRKVHIELGRWFAIPIFLIGVSGAYLSVERFDFFNNYQSTQYEYNVGDKYIDLDKFSLNQVKKIMYPFSSSANDTFKIQLSDRTITFQQGDNSFVTENIHSAPFLIKDWAYWFHTGESNIYMAILLSLSALALVFFIISGLLITSKTSWALFDFYSSNLNEAKVIILYGSETGNTYHYVKKLLENLKKKEDKVAICRMNNYRNFPKAEKFIVLTSTYGDGEAPSNANLFENKFKNYKQLKSIDYAVLGFGSKSYPKYCRFADVVNSLLSQEDGYSELYPIFKINNQDHNEYLSWEKKLINRFIN